ncbi:hypothetical protein L1987_73745 [Smallanthus sonchifolius]|uniref:Uncharacterized protein n=1 Tax=Smallanthus sonchifolius TaxID=185202 RepID=A0ACB9A161_9ASTR|nr:hypothetical protein L1987_73745 [Smallanthus sonchifolius]
MWNQQETRDFIAIRVELERDFMVAKRNRSLWEVVAMRMKELGYRRTPDQCKYKWKNLGSRYKGKVTSDQDYTHSLPFFGELHALFTKQTQTPFDPEAGSSRSKSNKRVKRPDSLEDEDEHKDEKTKITKVNLPPRNPQTSNLDKPPIPKPLSSRNKLIQEILHDFFQQQHMIDTRWRELMEKHAYERQLFKQEWRRSMERTEMERMRTERSWREKEGQRKTMNESRAERVDALLTLLLNKLGHEQ